MEPLSILVFIVFGVIALIQLIYYWALFSRFAFAREKAVSNTSLPPVSVVISARNEYSNLEQFLPAILSQDYPEYEVLVVNDFSDDGTSELLQDMQKQYPQLRVFTLHQHLNFFKGKKFPLSLGIKSAANDYLLLTDADCKPKSKQWISEMMKHYDDEVELVIGYGAYQKKKGLLNWLIRYETLKTALQYFSYALAGYPYMGTGRNLSYKRGLFYRVGGFTSHYQIASGDDDLFVNKVATPQNTRLAYNVESHTVSKPKTSFSTWFTQKSRHLTTGKHYRQAHKWRLAAYAFTKLLIYPAFAATLIVLPLGSLFYAACGTMGVFIASQIVITEKASRKLDEKNLGWGAPLLELFFVIFEPLWVFINLMSRNNKWK